MDIINLDGMKRAELQKLAKKAGIKANKKTEFLITELKKYYSENGSFDGEPVTDTCSSQTESATATESGTATEFESEPETKPKMTKGKRGRKAGGRKKAAATVSSDSEATCSTSPVKESQPISGVSSEEADTEKTPSPKKKTTKPRRGRKGRKRSATPSPVKEVTPAKVKKASPVQEKAATPKPATPVVKVSAKAHTPAPAVVTPQIKAAKTTRGSSSKRGASKVATPVPNCTKTATPDVAQKSKTSAKRSSGRKTTKRRRSTFEVDPSAGTPKAATPKPKARTPKPAAKVVKNEVKSCPKMKEAIMNEIEKKVQEQNPKQPITRIPKPKFGSKPVTPGNKNWAKIHEARMNKMESIDDYLERKRKRTETMCASVKRAKIVAEEAKAAIETLKAHRTPPVKGKQTPKIVKPVARPVPTFKSPRTATKSSLKMRKSAAPASFMSPAASKAPVAITTASKSVSFKVSKLKTPQPALVKKNSCQKRISTPGPIKAAMQSGRKSVGGTAEKRKSLTASARKSFGDAPRKSVGDAVNRKSLGGGITPYKFGGNQQLDSTLSAKKPAFDLKASLKKGLGYKPHTGKLKPLEEINYFTSKTQPSQPQPKAKVQLKMQSNITKAKGELKKPKIMSRVERRAGALKHRAGKRADDMMARRGIKM